MKMKFISIMLSISMMIAALTGCAAAEQTKSTASSGTVQSEATVSESDSAALSETSASLGEYFTERDLSGEYDEASATRIELSGTSAEISGSGATAKDGILTITEEGTYIVSGTLSDGQIVVSADESAKVQIVLNGVSITNDDSACILVLSADKVFLTAAAGTVNTLSDTGSAYSQASSDYTVDGVIFSRDDLVINGSGTIRISAGYKHGIVGKDDVKLASVTLDITAAGKGIAANDSIRIASGDYTIDAKDDALHTSNGTEEGRGYIYIADGTFDLKSGDDGIHAETDLIIDGGSILVGESYEGLEGLTITVNGGDLDITASDDGLNAASGSSDETGSGDAVIDYHSRQDDWYPGYQENDSGEASADSYGQEEAGEASDSGYELTEVAMHMGGQGMGGMMNDIDENAVLTINGGNLTVNAGGDGLDSNGVLVVNGGTVIVNGPTNNGNGALDCGISATVNGGTVIAVGSSGMAETFGEASTQYALRYNFGSTVSAGTTITLTDENGKEVLSFDTVKDCQSIVFSSAELGEGTYTITAGSQSDTITISTISTTAGSEGGMGGMGGFGHGNGMENQGSTGDWGDANGQEGFADWGDANGQEGFGPGGEMNGQGGFGHGNGMPGGHHGRS